jgi:hypothetical protein
MCIRESFGNLPDTSRRERKLERRCGEVAQRDGGGLIEWG